MPLPKVPPTDLTTATVPSPNDTLSLSDLLIALENLSLNALKTLAGEIMQLIIAKYL
jgi:hypothetical protein